MKVTETVHDRFGAETSRNWSPDENVNMLFLQTIENWLNDKLKARGFIFLNEVYNELGMRLTSQGAISGWLRSSGRPIKFELKEYPDAIVNKGELALTFITDGVIYDKIEEEQS